MSKKKRVKVKAWLIIDSRKRYPYAAYADKHEAHSLMRENFFFHKGDLLIPASIEYALPISKGRKGVKK